MAMVMDPDARVWLHHPETGGYFECPVAAVEHWQALGWVPAEQPPEVPNPAVAELVAWREQQAAEQAAEQAAQDTADPGDGAQAPQGKPRRGATTTTKTEE